jgi:hypothetical protein
MGLYKDEKGINYKTLDVQYKYIDNLAKICEEAFSQPQDKDKILIKKLRIPQNMTENGEHEPSHVCCKGCDTNARTEKRICRCMYYYNQNKWPKLCEKPEPNCKMYARWINKGDYIVEEYEWPTKYVLKNVGGIDLVLSDQDGNKYGVEVKPYYSKETVSRMVAEILTYTIGTEFIPSIAVFAGSEQQKMIEQLRSEHNNGWQIIEKRIKVFVILYSINGNKAEFSIKRY